MRSKLAIALLAAAVGACNHTPHDQPERGLSAVNVPMVTRADYVFDAAAPDGMLPPAEVARLSAWFQSLRVGYGDTIYVDGAYAGAARDQVAELAGNYGLVVSPAAPVTAGMVPPGTVRVIVSRNRVDVANCPNWNDQSQPNYANRSLSNFGCAVNSNLAAMVANPQDLVHGRDGGGITDPRSAVKPVTIYRTTPPSGSKGLQDISTKKDQ